MIGLNTHELKKTLGVGLSIRTVWGLGVVRQSWRDSRLHEEKARF